MAQRSTCLRSGYGAVAVIDDGIVSTGYNGSRSGAENCCDRGYCLREGSESRTNYHLCSAVHAEQNVVAKSKVSLIGSIVYLVAFDQKTGKEKVWDRVFPCITCFSLMIQAGVKELCIRKDDTAHTPFKAPLLYWSFLENRHGT